MEATWLDAVIVRLFSGLSQTTWFGIEAYYTTGQLVGP